MKKTIILAVFASLLAFVPIKAQAFQLERLIDPFCLFACDDGGDQPDNITNTYTDSNNTNSNINSPGSTVVSYTGVTATPVTIPNPVVVTVPNPIVVTTNTPVYYNQTYPTYPTNYNQNQTSPLGVSCYSNPTSGNIGDNVRWGASPYGGNGNYYITWSGSEGLSGYGTSINKTYYNTGSKYASVTVTSGGQSISQNCGNNVDIYDYNNNNNYNNNYNNNNYNNNSPLYVSCTANTSFAPVETNVIWTASATGGNGYYTYNWSGSDYLRGYGNSLNVIYHSAGQKTASVTVTSGNNQSITQTCSSGVTVGVPTQVYNNTYTPPVVRYVNTTRVVKVETPAKVVAKPVVQDDSLSASSLFSLKNVPWGWVAVLIILMLMFTVIYLILNRNKI